MAKRLDGMVVFSTEEYGFDKDQVGKHLAQIGLKYERLRKTNFYLKIACAFTFIIMVLYFLLPHLF